MIQMTVHKSVTINGQQVVEHTHEWVHPDDPRLRNGDANECRPVPCPPDPPEPVPPWGTNSPEPSTPVDGSEQTGGSAPAGQSSATSSPPEPTRSLITSASLSAAIAKYKQQREAHVPKQLSYQDHDDEGDESPQEPDEQEGDDDRPWQVTRQTLAEIDSMSPLDLEALIENLDAHEEWDELRETAKGRTAQRLGAIRKAKAAPRCRYVKTSGESCGSPALKDETLCYFHKKASPPAEETAKIVAIPLLEDRVSLQLAISQVCGRLAAGSMEEKTGRAIIAALRLAKSNLGDSDSIHGILGGPS